MNSAVGPRNSLTDVAGLLVGHHYVLDAGATIGTGAATGCTVVRAPGGAVAAVDVRGGGPGTRETDLLDPSNTVRQVNAILLTGGSAYGLAAADGVMRWHEEHGEGIPMDPTDPTRVVPIVPGAVIFDLPVGAWNIRPTADFGFMARRAPPSTSRAVRSVRGSERGPDPSRVESAPPVCVSPTARPLASPSRR